MQLRFSAITVLRYPHSRVQQNIPVVVPLRFRFFELFSALGTHMHIDLHAFVCRFRVCLWLPIDINSSFLSKRPKLILHGTMAG